MSGRGDASTLGQGAQAREMRVRSLLAKLDDYDHQKAAFSRVGDRYKAALLNRAHPSKRFMLVKEVEDGMLEAIKGGTAECWTTDTILKLTGSEKEKYFENVKLPGGKRPAPASISVRSSRSVAKSHSAAQLASPSSKPSTSSSQLEKAPRVSCGKEDYGDVAATPAPKRKKKLLSAGEVKLTMANVSTPLSAEELAAESRKLGGGQGAGPRAEPQLTSGHDEAEPPPVMAELQHVCTKGRDDAASRGGYFAGYSFAGFIETLGEPTFKMPQSNAEKKAAEAARKRAKEAAREKAKKEAAAAAALAEANRQETPAEKQKRIAREENVKQKMFNIDQENGSAAFMGIYRRLAISDVMVIFTYVVYLVFVYPAREPVIDEETCQYDEDGVLLRDTCKLLAPFRPWFPFGAVTFALLAIFGNMTNLLSILTVRITIALKGIKSPALLPVAKASTYTLYLGVWISFQSTISGVTRMPATIGRLQADIGLDPITTIFSIVSLINTILLTPQQLSQIAQSYAILYKGLLPIVSVNQLGSHLNGSVQQSMTLSSIVLFVFCLMLDSGQAGVEEPTIFSSLYLATYAQAVFGMLLAIAFGRITTMSRQIDVAAEKAEGEKEALTSTLSLDLSKDQEVLLKGYGGKKKKRNGSKVLILENMEKDEKLKVKVLESDDNSIEDLEIEVKYSQVESIKPKDELAKEAENVDLQKKLVDYKIIMAREKLVKMETLYLVMCQLADALMVVQIILGQLVVDLAGVSMFTDMSEQAKREAALVISNPSECAENGGSGGPCTSIQQISCKHWRHCGASNLPGHYPMCKDFCKIGDDTSHPYGEDPRNLKIQPLDESSSTTMMIISLALSTVMGMLIGCCAGCCTGGGCKGACGLGFCGMIFCALLGFAGFFYGYIYFGSEFGYEFCAVTDLGYPEPPPVVGQQRPLTEECIDMLSAHVVNADYKTGGTYTIMACMLGLAFYLMQSTILLSKKHSDENPLAYSAFQLKFYCYTTIFSLVLWVGIAQMDGWGVPEDSSFAEWDAWILNRSLIAKGFEAEDKFGKDFLLAQEANFWELREAQGKLQYLWLDPTVLMATVGPCIALQCVGLFILTRDRSQWKYIKYTLYLQFVQLGYFVFLLWLMCLSLRTSATLIALQFITMYWLFLLPFAGSIQSGLLKIGVPLSTPGQICQALLCPGIPFVCLYLLFIGVALVMVSAQHPALAEMAGSGYAMLSISGLVVGSIFLGLLVVGLKACFAATFGRLLGGFEESPE
eukprot:Transcript_17222.p1 GENE.Transcript_17222~~Transcript_17222.p1  ORF type:complete len:1277 (+),score=285.49 Transcript_17222:72-3833(+)